MKRERLRIHRSEEERDPETFSVLGKGKPNKPSLFDPPKTTEPAQHGVLNPKFGHSLENYSLLAPGQAEIDPSSWDSSLNPSIPGLDWQPAARAALQASQRAKLEATPNATTDAAANAALDSPSADTSLESSREATTDGTRPTPSEPMLELKEGQALTPEQAQFAARSLFVNADTFDSNTFGRNIVNGLTQLEITSRRKFTTDERSLILEGVISLCVSAPSRVHSLNVAVRDSKLAVTSHVHALLERKPPIGEDRLTFDAFLEQIAVRYAYLDGNDLEGLEHDEYQDVNDPNNPNNGKEVSEPAKVLRYFGFSAPRAVFGRWGMEMRVFTPTKNAKFKTSIVAFRGTEAVGFDPKKSRSYIDTAVGDMSPAGVGYSQYDQNEELIQRNVNHAAQSSPSGKAIFTGHSLGGALAQIAAVKQLDKSERIVTFMSPGIKREDVDQLDAYNKKHQKDGESVSSTHYRVEGDLVPGAGEAHTTGQIHAFDRFVKRPGDKDFSEPGLSGVAEAHVAFPLNSFLQGRDPKDLTPDQRVLAQAGASDPSEWQKPGTQAVTTASRSDGTDENTRPYLETMRQVLVRNARYLGVVPPDMAEATEKVFDQYASYYVLYEAIEGLAKREGLSYAAFLKESAKVLEQRESDIPKSLFDLAKELEIPDVEFDNSKPRDVTTSVLNMKSSAWAEMKKAGKVTAPDKKSLQDLRNQRERIWHSWNPGKSTK
jgi:Lipase (class 3)